ncbi:flavin-dependent oxidoreductase [Roseomonas sp. GC11]|uniref:flavin-dependent oxidoreductase n=1 Tax=Roseomonas sp. GC11 TaxID=2950546 RepID=UPI00210AC799|nr:flavin-dependent oxidoreductase [Roseomonas sp. GC11]MCQ4159114.1 flavin-dependent oxidoreductase [Roseomonas sp. GC11]
MRVLIAGGGIGGLTLALMLHQRGIGCALFEAAAEVRPLGVGINALPHCIRELAALGLLPQLDAIGIRTRRLTYANHLGQTIWSEPRGMHGGHDVPQFSIHRGRLQAMLWEEAARRLGREAIRPGQRLTAVTQEGEAVTVRLTAADGTESLERGDVLVGADGIHSALRALLHPQDPGIRWNGIQMWRGAVEWPAFEGGDAMVVAGDGVAKLVLYPIAPGLTPETRLTNWVIYARTAEPGAPLPARESWSRRGRYEDFAAFAGRLNLPFIAVEALIRATPDIFEYPMCDRDPLPFWTQGRVTLLGDAAHAMYPVGSNGASQAILDARCLADLLERHPAPEALARYEAERLPATAAIIRSNRTGGPERVIDLLAERAPAGFTRLEDVIDPREVAEVAQGYARLAGFAVASSPG